MSTDSDIIFSIITKRRTTTEKRMMVDLMMFRAAYENREIANIALIDSIDNPADALCKVKPNSALRKLLDTHFFEHVIVQFVKEQSRFFLRNMPNTSDGVNQGETQKYLENGPHHSAPHKRLTERCKIH